jgi:hypothetical protein
MAPSKLYSISFKGAAKLNDATLADYLAESKESCIVQSGWLTKAADNFMNDSSNWITWNLVVDDSYPLEEEELGLYFEELSFKPDLLDICTVILEKNKFKINRNFIDIPSKPYPKI